MATLTHEEMKALSQEQVVEALNNSGYITKPEEVLSAEFKGETPSGFCYSISFPGNEEDVEHGMIFIEQLDGRLVAEY